MSSSRSTVSPVAWVFGLATFALALPAAVGAQTIQWGGDVRPRFEFRDVDGGSNTAFTTMRTRVDLARALNPDARIFIQFQDARYWGEEEGVGDGSADRLDVHQAYMELGHRGTSPLFLRIGRQEAEFAEGRLVGMPVWSQVGNAYDGVRATVKLGDVGLVDLFGYQVREEASTTNDRDDTLYGAWAEFPFEGRSLQLFGLHDREGVETGAKRTTAGVYYLASVGPVSYRVEGAIQRGDLGIHEIDANMLAARITLPVLEGRGDLTLWFDRYSGDAEAFASTGAPTGTFHDLVGRNHRFFGYADLFSNIPVDTQGRGIQDVALKGSWGLWNGGRLGLDLHRFFVADDAGLSDAVLADEADLYLRKSVLEGIDLLGGASYVVAGEAGKAIGTVDADRFFFYLQLQASF